MFNYIFLTVKYTVESSLLCLALALLLKRNRKALWAVLRSMRWLPLFLCSGLMQGLLHYGLTVWFGNALQAQTFTPRYILSNTVTMLLFWRLCINDKRDLSLLYGSYLLITMQFCQIMATYVVYYMRESIQIVTDFGPPEQLISQFIILAAFAVNYIVAFKLSRKTVSITPREAALCAIFDWFFFIIGRLLGRFFMGAQLYPYISVSIYLLFLIEMVIFFAISMEMVHLRETSIEEARLAQQYALQMQHNDEISVLYRDFRRLRHEEKNQEIYVWHLLKTGQYADLEEYFKKLANLTDSYSMRIDSGNQLVNSILWAKAQAAEHERIAMKIDAHVPSDLPIEGPHLCSLLVNLLDNAIEASRRASSPSISVKLCMKQDYLFCYVTNNIDEGSLSSNPELKSTKKDKTMHGFGIRTVKLIAEQYHGDCEFSVKDGRFFATVMLACGTAEPSRRGA